MKLSGTILFAEDDDNYANLFAMTFRQGGFAHQLRHVSNGDEALAYLKGEGHYMDRSIYPVPCLVLSDLKMPRVNGFELIQFIRRSPALSYLPIVVLTCSDELADVKKAYALGANSFLVKPPNIEDLKNMLKTLDDYWLKFNVTQGAPTIVPMNTPQADSKQKSA